MTARRRAPRAPAQLRAITTDLWFTLCYLPSSDRRRVEAERRRAWEEPLRAGGIPARRAHELFRALQRWNDVEERRGYAPTLRRQGAWLELRTGVPVDAAQVTARLDSSLRTARVRPAPGVRATLRELSDRGMSIGLVSNLIHETSRAATRILRELRLDEYYSSRQFSPDLPWSKPLPGPYLRCLKELRITAESAVHVGDRFLDIQGARRAGMGAIAYTGLHHAEFGRTIPAAERPAARTPRAATWAQVLELLDLTPG
jgi:FMN phosphatase YigB (HAD superfamily)